MNKKEDICKDSFIKNLMKGIDLEEAPDQFTNKVMDDVMQDWLAKPIEMKKPISRNQWIWLGGVLFFVLLILLGTDVRTLISASENPFLQQVDAMFLQPLNQALNKVFVSFLKLPVMVYIVAISFVFLAAFDRIINKLLHFR